MQLERAQVGWTHIPDSDSDMDQVVLQPLDSLVRTGARKNASTSFESLQSLFSHPKPP